MHNHDITVTIRQVKQKEIGSWHFNLVGVKGVVCNDIHLLELAALCLSREGEEDSNIISFMSYLRFAHGLELDSKRSQLMSENSPAYQALLEFEGALVNSANDYPKLQWRSYLYQCLSKNREYLVQNRKAIQSYVEPYLEAHKELNSSFQEKAGGLVLVSLENAAVNFAVGSSRTLHL